MTPVTETGTVLDRIVAQTRIDLEARKQAVSREALQARFAEYPAPVPFRDLLRRETVTVIAEVKRASPSKGRFPVEVDPPTVAREYAHGGAAAISCLTDGPFFEGSLDDLESVVDVTQGLDRPVGVLRKDFMVDPYQVDEARAYGASCVLLIVACLTDTLLRELHAHADTLGLSTLVEVHNEQEIESAVAAGATLIGINNRDLRTLEVDLAVTNRLAAAVPADVVLVGESGIHTVGHVQAMADAGVDAILVGESLIVQRDRAGAVRALTGVRKLHRG
ncbi:MAG: indole-3-glycerol phosphate synthase TrpC [Chloroflexota bacterium]|nr:indole-3-glycerol phosphate synthase TrpC [Chloroflexota bacterium]